MGSKVPAFGVLFLRVSSAQSLKEGSVISSPSFQIIEVGNPLLFDTAQPVQAFDLGLKSLLEDLLEVMTQRNGVGIAAPQVGLSQQIMVIHSRPNSRYPNAVELGPLFLINPNIVWESEERVQDWEGCLSVPGIRGLVTRSQKVNENYQDEDGNRHELHLDGFPARIFLHEYDHLIGKTFLDRVDSVRDLYSEKECQKRMAS